MKVFEVERQVQGVIKNANATYSALSEYEACMLSIGNCKN